DRLDREVVRSDPNGFRIFTKYDILGRVILTGKDTTMANPSGGEHPDGVQEKMNTTALRNQRLSFSEQLNIHCTPNLSLQLP
ncbi:MAG TPA: hypothetical protein PKM27_16610, partial [Saprospiraceae bacterium]|nr:hypothetical protein [Saprospiraceae bacterium]